MHRSSCSTKEICVRAIYPCLWFDNQAEEAMNTYLRLFDNSEVLAFQRLSDSGPSEPGSVLVAHFRLANIGIMALNGGPEQQPNPSISLFVESSDPEQVDAFWNALSEGGEVLMEYGEYPWAAKYGWCNDRFGVSWQVSTGEQPLTIAPSFHFVGDQFGKAEDAITTWTRIFPESDSGLIFRQEGGDDPARKGTVLFSRFMLGGQQFIAMDDNGPHDFTFSEGVSIVAECDDQAEVDHLWSGLIANGGSEHVVGWLKDRYGVSWQIVPTRLLELVQDPDPAKVERVTNAMMQMVKLDIAELQRAHDGVPA
jgi:predicted 3-demethylubiquinone-9 3-methyltransferase (glyoxalase superfamily)